MVLNLVPVSKSLCTVDGRWDWIASWSSGPEMDPVALAAKAQKAAEEGRLQMERTAEEVSTLICN